MTAKPSEGSEATETTLTTKVSEAFGAKLAEFRGENAAQSAQDSLRASLRSQNPQTSGLGTRPRLTWLRSHLTAFQGPHIVAERGSTHEATSVGKTPVARSRERLCSIISRYILHR